MWIFDIITILLVRYCYHVHLDCLVFNIMFSSLTTVNGFLVFTNEWRFWCLFLSLLHVFASVYFHTYVYCMCPNTTVTSLSISSLLLVRTPRREIICASRSVRFQLNSWEKFTCTTASTVSNTSVRMVRKFTKRLSRQTGFMFRLSSFQQRTFSSASWPRLT